MQFAAIPEFWTSTLEGKQLLHLEGVWAGYGRTLVLRGVSLALEPGEIVAVLGRNGMGKSTLLKTIIGLVPCARGSIRFDGHEISHMAPHRRARLGIAYVPQGREIFPRLSVRDNLRVAAMAVGQPPETAVATAVAEFPALARLLGLVGGALSGGQQQQLALARALAGTPRVLLLDEPSEGIQPSVVGEIGDRLRQLARTRNLGVVLVEQNLDFAARVAGRGYILRKGEVVQELPTAELLEQPELQRDYMGV